MGLAIQRGNAASLMGTFGAGALGRDFIVSTLYSSKLVFYVFVYKVSCNCRVTNENLVVIFNINLAKNF